MKRISIFLITAALIAGMVGCVSQSYALAIASTAGGSVTTPGEGMFTYEEGTVVNLTVEAEAGYHFVNWTGDVGTITNVEAATAAIAMDDSYFIRANFAAIPPVQYNLTVSSTAGGSVTAPGEGTFAYGAATMVDLAAEAGQGYRFINWTGDVGTVTNVEAAETAITMDGSYSITANFGEDIAMVTAGNWHTVGLSGDGTVVAVGRNIEGQCDVSAWTNITQVAAGYSHTVGLESDGTVVATGYNGYGQCDVGNWADIFQVAAGEFHTVGIESDGSVVAVGRNSEGQCNISDWTDIIQVAAGLAHTVGLRSDGTVVAVGDPFWGQCDVDDWTDIIQVTAGWYHTVGLKSDGSVVVTGMDAEQYNVSDWTNIVQVAAGNWHTVGLKSDGTTVAAVAEGEGHDYGQCNVELWANITQVTAGSMHTVGLTSEGTVVAVGLNNEGQCDVGDWGLN
jgi:hypothetical protein